MKKQKSIIQLLIVLSLLMLSCNSSNDLKYGVDDLSNYALTQIKGIPSLSVVIVKGDEIVVIGTYGFADVENQVEATPATPYYIASTTKSFTGTLAQILHEENVLDLNASITSYKPIKNFDNKMLFEGVTLRDLLSHSSGLSNGYLVWRNGTSGQYEHQQLIDILENYTSDLENNKEFKYGNLGYNIFDLILQEEFGLDWKALMEEKIFEPLGMKATTAYYNKSVNGKIHPVQSYICIGDSTQPVLANSRKDEKTMQAAGGIYSSIEDIANWLIFNIENGKYEGKTLYNSDMLRHVHSSYSNVNKKSTIFTDIGYGLGWHISKYKNHNVLYHNGGFLGNSAKISFMPDQKIGVAVFSNESFFGDNIGDLLASYVYDYYLDSLEETTSEWYYEEIRSLVKRISKMNKSYAASLSERINRQPTLTLNLNKYIGHYSNEGFGDFTLRMETNNIYLGMGLLNSKAYYGKMPNSLEVELTGPGSKETVEFKIKDSTVASLIFKSLIFNKKKDE